MVLSKGYLVKAISSELEDRYETGAEADELAGLQSLKLKVETEQPLDFAEYDWLCYLVANQREDEVREEMESQV